MARNHDLLAIRPDAEVGFCFFDGDGVEVTGAPGQVAAVLPRSPLPPGPRSCERAGPEERSSSAPAPRSCERGSSGSSRETSEIDEDARPALARLGLHPRESAKAIKSAREALGRRRGAVTLESLLREAPSVLPGPRARHS